MKKCVGFTRVCVFVGCGVHVCGFVCCGDVCAWIRFRLPDIDYENGKRVVAGVKFYR